MYLVTLAQTASGKPMLYLSHFLFLAWVKAQQELGKSSEQSPLFA